MSQSVVGLLDHATKEYVSRRKWRNRSLLQYVSTDSVM